MSRGIVCSSCNKPKNELHPQPSRLMKGQVLYLCSRCIELKYEPRWVVILVGRVEGAKAVLEYIEKHRYCGDVITAKELLA